MYINGIDFDNRIIDAIKNNTLVVFAGAGVSRNSPTNLPNFEELASRLAEGTQFEKNSDESCEVFLGALKSNDINVNLQTAKMLSEENLIYNKFHESIVDLFLSPKEVKIVTTNYDKMFEQVMDKKGIKYNVFISPALPLGNDVSGIIHIHGSVDNPKYMVVTDDDFGKAYLTDGYVSKFLTKLFDSYTVLFIGYSYKDTILRYLTRAISREHASNMFILTDDEKTQWKNLGITPIVYPKKSHAVMRDSLDKVGLRAKRSLLEWKECLLTISDFPPQDLTIDSEVDYCLEDLERTQVLANIIHGKEWIEILDKKELFTNLFEKSKELTEKELIWANWLCDVVIGKEDESFRNLYYKYGNKINKQFVSKIIDRICDQSISKELFREYVVLLDSYIKENLDIYKLIHVAKEKDLPSICYVLYKKLWNVNFCFKKNFWNDSKEYAHFFIGNYHTISYSWDICRDYLNSTYSKDFLVFYKTKLDELCSMYYELEHITKTKEPFNLIAFEIEKESDLDSDNPLSILLKHTEELVVSIEKIDKEFLKCFLFDGIDSSYIFIKRIYLKLIRITNILSSDESYMILKHNNLLNETWCKEQVFLLIKKIYRKLSKKNKNDLFNYIESIDTSESEYEKYNWCIWIQKECGKSKRIEGIISDILTRNDYEPRKHPEKNIYILSENKTKNKSEKNIDDLVNMKTSAAIKYLHDYKDNVFEGYYKDDLLEIFSQGISKNYKWSKRIFFELIKGKLKDREIWNYYFNGLYSNEYQFEETVYLLEQISKSSISLKHAKQIADVLWKLVQKSDLKEEILKNEDRIWRVISAIWKKREIVASKTDAKINLSLNTTDGMLLYSLIYLISYNKTKTIKSKYKTFMEKAMSSKEKNRNISIFTIVGHFNFLYFRDKKWCEEHLIKFIKSNKKEIFSSSWEGIVYISRKINLDTADTMSPLYLYAVSHLSWFSKDARNLFIDLYLTLIIYVIKNPIKKYIPEFYKFAEQKDKTYFLSSISNRLSNMEDESQLTWWNSWLKQFVINAVNNKPAKPSNDELKEIFGFVVIAKSILLDLVDIICEIKPPKEIDETTFYKLSNRSFDNKESKAIQKLITCLLNNKSIQSYQNHHITNIVSNLSGLSNKEKTELKEAAIKNNIQLDI